MDILKEFKGNVDISKRGLVTEIRDFAVKNYAVTVLDRKLDTQVQAIPVGKRVFRNVTVHVSMQELETGKEETYQMKFSDGSDIRKFTESGEQIFANVTMQNAGEKFYASLTQMESGK